MEFGRVPENELNQVNFSLPQEPADNKKILEGKPAKDPKIYFGCAKWGRVEWVGKIYPPKTTNARFFATFSVSLPNIFARKCGKNRYAAPTNKPK